jgi:hypothetical protein
MKKWWNLGAPLGNFNLKTAIKSFESCGYFWVGRLTANNQYFNLGLTVMYIQGKFGYFSYSV